MSNPRVLKCHRDAVTYVLEQHGLDVSKELVDELATAAVTAEDGEHLRFVIVTYLRHGDAGTEWDVYGPYASRDAATKSLEAGITHHPEQRAAVFAMSPAPREWKPKRTKKKQDEDES